MLAATAITKPAHAQISFSSDIGIGDGALCAKGDVLTVASGEIDCDSPHLPIQPNKMMIGPNGSQTILDAKNGSATFQGAATFQGSTQFQGTTSFTNGATFVGSVNVNGALAASTGTFSGTVNMNGGFAVANGQTVDMGGNRVQNVGAPVAGNDATNKSYVDVLINNVVAVTNQQSTRLTNVEAVNAQQDARLGVLENGVAAINQSIRSLSNRDRELADGIAISLAVAQPIFQPGQTFAMRVGWGNFDGSNALGVSAAGLLAKFNNGNTVVLDVGFGGGARTNVYAGRAGLTFGW